MPVEIYCFIELLFDNFTYILHTCTIHSSHTYCSADLSYPLHPAQTLSPPVKFPFRFHIFFLVFVCFAPSCISLGLSMWVRGYPLLHELSHQWLYHEVNEFLHLRTLKYQYLLWSDLGFMAPSIFYDNIYGLSLSFYVDSYGCCEFWAFSLIV